MKQNCLNRLTETAGLGTAMRIRFTLGMVGRSMRGTAIVVPAAFCMFPSTGISSDATVSIARENVRKATKQDDTSSRTKRLVAPPGIVIEQDVSYLPSDRTEKLDLYYPSQRTTSTLSPAVLIIHGGGWVAGDKAGQREYVTGCALAKAGYLCASVEYMKEAGKRWPTNLSDCKNAVRWLRTNARRLQVDPDHIGVIGGSAGGHLALMVAYTSRVSELQPSTSYTKVLDNVQACVDLSLIHI